MVRKCQEYHASWYCTWWHVRTLQSTYDLKQKRLSSEETQNKQTAGSLAQQCDAQLLWSAILLGLEVALALQERRSDEALDLWCLDDRRFTAISITKYQSQLHQRRSKITKTEGGWWEKPRYIPRSLLFTYSISACCTPKPLHGLSRFCLAPLALFDLTSDHELSHIILAKFQISDDQLTIDSTGSVMWIPCSPTTPLMLIPMGSVVIVLQQQWEGSFFSKPKSLRILDAFKRSLT